MFEEEDRFTELDLDDLFDAFDEYAERFTEDPKAAESEALAAVAVFDDAPELAGWSCAPRWRWPARTAC